LDSSSEPKRIPTPEFYFRKGVGLGFPARQHRPVGPSTTAPKFLKKNGEEEEPRSFSL